MLPNLFRVRAIQGGSDLAYWVAANPRTNEGRVFDRAHKSAPVGASDTEKLEYADDWALMRNQRDGLTNTKAGTV